MPYQQDNAAGFRPTRYSQPYTRTRRTTQQRDQDTRDREVQFPPQVFTELDKTVKRFSQSDAYAHAAMVIRTRNNLKPTAVVFADGSYDSQDATPVYTLEEFSQQVQRLIRR